MRVRHVSIRNFRGVRSAEWGLSSHFACLIGQGDCGKSTVLDAIGLALSHRWSVAVTDADFFNCDTSEPISITVTVGDLPAELMREDPYGHWLRGVEADGSVLDEPSAESEPALSVRFTVDDTLEPRWQLWKEAQAELGQERSFHSRERSLLGLFEVDDRFDAHLKWAQGSALSHLSGQTDVGALLAKAQRQARKSVFDNPSQALLDAASSANKKMKKLSGAAFVDPRPGLDPSSMGRAASLILHDSQVPATQLGLGSRRIASLAFQLAAVDQESIVLIDEIESGLEPHRLLHLLDHLRKRGDSGKGQVVITTHSPLVVEAVEASELHVVRKDKAVVSVLSVPTEIADMKASEPQATIRSGPSAMLARRIVVCEGKTEVGLCRALVKHWNTDAELPAALVGTAIRHGSGGEAPRKARCLAKLGYAVALLTDNDLSKQNKERFDRDVETAKADGVEVIAWDDGNCIETELVSQLSEGTLSGLLKQAAGCMDGENPEERILSAITTQLDGRHRLTGLDVSTWVAGGLTLSNAREAIGKAAKSGGWFKDETRGELLGELLVGSLAEFGPTCHTSKCLAALRCFVFNYPKAESSAESGTPA